MGLTARRSLVFLCSLMLFYDVSYIFLHPNIKDLPNLLRSRWISKPQEGAKTRLILNPDMPTCPELHKGALISASLRMDSEELQSAFFVIISHSETSGTLGLMLNGKEVPVGSGGTVRIGGPQEREKRHQLHHDASISHSRKLAEGLFFGGDMRRTPQGKVSVYYGSMYWKPGQLQVEFDRGLWVLSGDISADSV